MSDHRMKSVQFGKLDAGTVEAANNSIDLLRDVQLVMQAELGKANRLVRDVLRLQVGSVIELDKEAGDPVDILVNNKAIARGEVVEVDGKYGVRITEIVR